MIHIPCTRDASTSLTVVRSFTITGEVWVALSEGDSLVYQARVPADALRAALDEVAPVQEQAGSYTRTTSPDLMDGGVTSARVEEEADAAYTRTDEEASLRLAAEQIAEAQAEATAAVTAKEKAEQELAELHAALAVLRR